MQHDLLHADDMVALHFRAVERSGESRESDQRLFVADIAKTMQILGWQPQVGKVAGIQRILEWVDHAG